MADRRAGSSDPSTGSDAELSAALAGYVAWARSQGLPPDRAGLPAPGCFEPLAAGRVVDDFELVRELGGGAMGVVWEARQRSVPGQTVALKFLRAHFDSTRASARFRREVATVARLDHPTIVPIVSASTSGPRPYYAMKYVPGVSAARLVRELRERGDAPRTVATARGIVARRADLAERSVADEEERSSDWRDSYAVWVATLGLQLADALQHAAERGVVHRDVKPGNVMIHPRGRPVLVDFGLASLAEEEGLTGSADFLGTMPYASPEQVRGQELDARSDLYSLGVTLYELLTLTRPFYATGRAELARRIETEEPPPLPKDLPRDLRTIVGCALAKAPAQRYEAPGRMAADLRAFLSGRPISARPPGLFARGIAVARRRPRAFAAAGAALLALGGLRARDHVQAWARVREARPHVARAESLLGRLSDELCDYQERFDRAGLQHIDRDPIELSEEQALLQATRDEFDAACVEAEDSLRHSFAWVGGFRPAERLLARVCGLRIERALMYAEELRDPRRFERLERALRDLEPGSPLLDERGLLALRSEVPGARLEVWRDGTLVRSGESALTLEDMPEGVYQVVARAEGHAEARLPVLVRRDPVYLRGATRPARETLVELLRRDEVRTGMVHVPGGWTLVQDDPPRWELVPGFQLAPRELTYGEWAAFLDAAQADPEGLGRLCPAEELVPTSPDGTVHLERDPREGRWRPAPVGLARTAWPVRGLSPHQMGDFVAQHLARAQPAPEGWVWTLPTRREWMRAARGADARRYPWGSDFDPAACTSYESTERMGADPFPRAAGSAARDRSPFGLEDMAGSLTEVTLTPHGPVGLEQVLCGGSFRDWAPEQFELERVARGPNRPLDHVGFRVALRREAQPAVAPAETWSHQFEGVGAAAEAAAWEPFHGDPATPEVLRKTAGRVTLEEGCLVLRARAGNGSLTTSVVRRLRLAEGSRLTVRTRLAWAADEDRGRGLELRLSGGGEATLKLTRAGRAHLKTVAGGLEVDEQGTVAGLDPSDWHFLELELRDRRLEVRLWQADRARPETPSLPARMGIAFAAPPRLELTAHNLVGVTLWIDEVRLEAVAGARRER